MFRSALAGPKKASRDEGDHEAALVHGDANLVGLDLGLEERHGLLLGAAEHPALLHGGEGVDRVAELGELARAHRVAARGGAHAYVGEGGDELVRLGHVGFRRLEEGHEEAEDEGDHVAVGDDPLADARLGSALASSCAMASAPSAAA